MAWMAFAGQLNGLAGHSTPGKRLRLQAQTDLSSPGLFCVWVIVGIPVDYIEQYPKSPLFLLFRYRAYLSGPKDA